MMCSELLLLLLCGLLSGQAKVVSNYSVAIDSYDLVTNPCQDVRLAGFICVDCETLGFCSYSGDKWQTVEMSTCKTQNGFYCSDEGTFGCTWQPRCAVPVRGKFYCQGSGMYPDPYDCRSYHECSAQNLDTPHHCTNGAGYSLATNSCTLPRESAQCAEKQYTCTYVGQTGAWPADNSFYYVCQSEVQGANTIYYPLMMKCNNGYVHNGHSCVKPSKMRAVEQEQEQVVCQDGLRHASDNPNAYFSCHDGKLVFQACPFGSYYDAAEKLCLPQPEVCQEGESYATESMYGFNYCMHGQLVYQRCPIKYYFDAEFDACRRLEETCKDFTTSPAKTSLGYYMCIRGKLIYQSCPKETLFYDESRNVCLMNQVI